MRPLDGATSDNISPRPRRVPHSQRPADRTLTERRGDPRLPRIPKAMRRAKESWPHGSGAFNRLDPHRQVAADVGRSVNVELSMEVAVVSQHMTLVGHSPDQLGPAVHMSTQYEEGRFHAPCRECVQNARGGDRIRAVVEGQCHRALRGGQGADGPPEDRAVAVVNAVQSRTGDRDAAGNRPNHAGTRTLPRTEWYTSSTCEVTLAHE